MADKKSSDGLRKFPSGVAAVRLALVVATFGLACGEKPEEAIGGIAPILSAADKTIVLLRTEEREVPAEELEKSLAELKVSMTTPRTAKTEAQIRERELRIVNESLAHIAILRTTLAQNKLRSTVLLDELEARLAILRSELKEISTGRPVVDEKIWGFLAVLPWPVVVGLFLGYLLISKRAPERVADIFKLIKALKLPGFEVLLQGGEKEVQRIFGEYREQVVKDFNGVATSLRMQEKLRRVVESINAKLGLPEEVCKEIRATVHVEDVLFEDTLYQLLDYHPKGGGVGRVFTIRFGIIGKAWRSDESQVQEQVPTDSRKLVLEWGMTKGEAGGKGVGKQSFACVVLMDKPNGVKVGLFYMDADRPNAFGGQASGMQQLIESECKEVGLIDSLVKMRTQMRNRAPRLKVHE